MSLLLHGDCLEHMKDLDDDSIDLIFCDLPYATDKYSAVSCKWNTPIDLDKFWIEVMRIKKLNTPIFFTTTTKFGVELINSAPKKCHFRYDIVWVKSAPVGFLSAKKMPMRKHEMVYVFYEKLPYYDLSSHKHKFIKEVPTNEDYDKREKKSRNTIKKEENYGKGYLDKKVNFRKYDPKLGGKGAESHIYDPPLPTTIVKEEPQHNSKMVLNEKSVYGEIKTEDSKECGGHQQRYDPPLPTSIVKEEPHNIYDFDPKKMIDDRPSNVRTPTYDPPLPTTMLEIKSTKGKHSTEKPVALMEWILKYYSKEGDTILDPTMGSGSTGVACKNMKRNFIGIEMDDDIFDVAYKRINE